jgi:hypothetical protein
VYASRNDLPRQASWFVLRFRKPILGARGKVFRVTLPRAGIATGEPGLIPVAWYTTRFVALEHPDGVLSADTATVTRVTRMRTEFGFLRVSAITVEAPGARPLTSPET